MMDRIGYNKSFFFVLLIICAQIAAGLRHYDPPCSSSSSSSLHCRGGGEEEESPSTTDLGQTIYPDLTVAILGKDLELYTTNDSHSWLKDFASSGSGGAGCLLIRGVDDKSSSSGTLTTTVGSIISSKLSKTASTDENDDDDVSLVETLAFLCDVVVVLLPKDMSNSANNGLWMGIVQGAERRKETLLLSKTHLLLVSSQPMEFSQNEQQKSLFASVETVTTNDLMKALEAYLSKTDLSGTTTISNLFDDNDDSNHNDKDMSLPFAEVMKQVYQSLSSADDSSTRREFQFRPLSATIDSKTATIAISTTNAETVTTSTTTTTTETTTEESASTTNEMEESSTPTKDDADDEDEAVSTITTTDTEESASTAKMGESSTPPPPNDTTDDGDEAAFSSSVEAQDEKIMSILAKAQSQLKSLETKLEDTMLALAEEEEEESLDDKKGGMPLLFLDFGNLANELLEEAYEGLKALLLSNKDGIPPNIIISKIVGELQFLYKEQVQLMRDYYGRRYETLLDQLAQELEEEKITRQQAGERAGKATDEMIQSFQAASQHAIPKLCHQNGGELAAEFGANFDFSKETKGLIDDIMEATKMRTPVENEEDDGDAMQGTSNVPLSRWQRFHTSIPKWAKRLLARGVMLGVNYAQGWLAWQGLKRAAAERDRKMPKFPLF